MTAGATGTLRQRVATYLQRVGLTGAQIVELRGDASDRRYVRVVLDDGSSKMMLVHSGPIDPDTLPFLSVARLFADMSIPIPAVHDTAADLGILVLDDLGDITLQTALRTASAPQQRALYTEAVSVIGRLQRLGRTRASPAHLPFTRSFDEEKLVSELEFFRIHYLEQHLKADLGSAARDTLDREFRRLAQQLANEPRVLCHRDYHSRNLMLHEGTLYVIDFQDARLGPDTYDLVSLLRDCYVSLPSRLVDEMVAAYREGCGLGRTPTEPDYRERFDRMSVQRHLKALGTFGYQAAVVGNSGYLDDVPRTVAYLADVFARRPRFEQLRRVLAPYIPALG